MTGDFAYTSGNALVDENANELWSVLVCKPWLYGELGTTAYATPVCGRSHPGPLPSGHPVLSPRPSPSPGECH